MLWPSWRWMRMGRKLVPRLDGLDVAGDGRGVGEHQRWRRRGGSARACDDHWQALSAGAERIHTTAELVRSDDGAWSSKGASPEEVRSEHGQAMRRYMAALDPAFAQAQESCEFDFMHALVHVFGLQLRRLGSL